MVLIQEVRGFKPKIGRDCWVAPNATIVGDVKMGDGCSVWFGAVLRGDVNYIKIGNNTNIQDNVTIHGTYQTSGTLIGDHVSIGHNAVVHGCTVENNVLIGMGAVILDNAVIKSGSIIAANAVVLAGTVVDENTLYGGVPAKKIKKIDDKNREMQVKIASNYQLYASWYVKK